MATNHSLKKIQYDSKDVQVESAIRDGNGNVIATTYAKAGDIPSATTSVDGLSGGTLTSPLTIKGGDSASASKIILDQTQAGQITNNGTSTLFGFTSNNATALTIGHSSYSLAFRGSGTRPTYNGNQLALYSDIQWTNGFDYYDGAGMGECYNRNSPNETYSMQIGDSGFTVDDCPPDEEGVRCLFKVDTSGAYFLGSKLATTSDIPSTSNFVTTSISTSTSKRYLVGSSSTTSMATKNTNASCYMSGGELFSNNCKVPYISYSGTGLKTVSHLGYFLLIPQIKSGSLVTCKIGTSSSECVTFSGIGTVYIASKTGAMVITCREALSSAYTTTVYTLASAIYLSNAILIHIE